MATTLPSNAATTAQRLAGPTLPKNRFGFLRPLQLDLARDIATVSGDDLLESRIGQVVGSAGEFPWRPGLNGNLDKVRTFKNDAVLAAYAQVAVGQALATYLPEVLVRSVQTTRAGNLLKVMVNATRAADVAAQPPRPLQTSVTLPT